MGWLESQDGTNHPALSSSPGDKEKVIPLRGAAVSDRAQVLAWCSLSHMGVVLLAANTVMDRAGSLYPPPEDRPAPLPHIASPFHELADWNLCSQRPSAIPPDVPLWGVAGGLTPHACVLLCHQAPEALPEIRHTFPWATAFLFLGFIEHFRVDQGLLKCPPLQTSWVV